MQTFAARDLEASQASGIQTMDEAFDMEMKGVKQVEVELLRGTDKTKVLLSYGWGVVNCTIHLVDGDRLISGTAGDFFEALCVIRKELDTEGALLNCYGASLNVYPSSMGRDMGSGLQAYKETFGRKNDLPDLVDIFEAGPDVQPATVEAQRDRHQAWLNDLRQRQLV